MPRQITDYSVDFVERIDSDLLIEKFLTDDNPYWKYNFDCLKNVRNLVRNEVFKLFHHNPELAKRILKERIFQVKFDENFCIGLKQYFDEDEIIEILEGRMASDISTYLKYKGCSNRIFNIFKNIFTEDEILEIVDFNKTPERFLCTSFNSMKLV